MYSTCLFCNTSLGANEVLEDFPVGRRLAFDSATGRLWVVCRSCERWNLSPIEERWEVVEECERLFGSTRMRVSTENIGLARLSEGLELVRIGKPQRPEFAAWRYGDQFGRRRRKMFVRAGVGLAAVGVVLTGAATAGIAMGGFFQFGGQLYRPIFYGSDNKVVARIPVGQRRVDVKRKHLRKIRLLTSGEAGWQIEIPDGKAHSLILSGQEGQNAAGLLLPAINQAGGNRNQVQTAVQMLDVAGDPNYYLASVARGAHGVITTGRRRDSGLPGLPAEVRLALEMATHEESERRALEGELKALEIAWKEADEIAAISDSLFVPTFIKEAIERFRK